MTRRLNSAAGLENILSILMREGQLHYTTGFIKTRLLVEEETNLF
jgi:hypothetical protein